MRVCLCDNLIKTKNYKGKIKNEKEHIFYLSLSCERHSLALRGLFDLLILITKERHLQVRYICCYLCFQHRLNKKKKNLK